MPFRLLKPLFPRPRLRRRRPNPLLQLLLPRKTTRVKLSKVLEDRFYKNTLALDKMPSVTAESAVTLALDWITRFFQDTKAEELAEFFRIGDQETLYDKLADFFAPHLVKHLERFSNTPERKLLAHFTSQLVMQFLTQAFCGYRDDRYEFTNARHSKKVCVMLGQKLNPYWDELEKKQTGTAQGPAKRYP